MAAELGDLPVFVIGPNGLASAYFEIAAERRRGAEFAVMMLVAEPRAMYAYTVAAQAVKSGDYYAQRTILDAVAAGTLVVNGKPFAEALRDDPTRVLVMDISRMADTLVVRSWQNAEMQRGLRGYPHPHVARWYPARTLPNVQAARLRDLVVIWAPDYPAEHTALHTFSLHSLHTKVAVVCRGGAGAAPGVQYVDVDSPDVASILGRALCVVDTSLDDPSWVQAFAASGFSVAATSTSGALEVAEGLAIYEPWSHKGIWGAVLQALSRRASIAIESPPSVNVIARSLEAGRPEQLEHPPLVTAITATYNREEHLRRSVATLVAQTYTNLEIIIVNDGGRPVTGLPDDPRIRVIEHEVNRGVTAAGNTGLAAAKGEYIQFLADDDELYPDHIMRLVSALERTHADVAHSNIIIRYEAMRNGQVQTIGFNCSVFCEPLDGTEVYAASPVAGQAMLVRRSAYDRTGPFEERVILEDQEMQIRLAQISDFVHVPRVTGDWLVREAGDSIGGTRAKDFPEDLRRIYELHPMESAYIKAVRERTVKNVANRPPGFVFPPVISLQPLKTEEQVRPS